jgi:hypothetical protein
MKNILWIILVFFPFLWWGCSSTSSIMIIETKALDCSSIENIFTYENDTIRVAYIFWAENGNMGLFIHNKLKQPLYIDWKKCSLITGAEKHDYWQDIQQISSNSTSLSEGTNLSQSQTSTLSRSVSAFSTDTKGEVWQNFWNPKNIEAKSKTEGTAAMISHSNSSTVASNEFLQQTFSSTMAYITKLERITFIPPGTTVCKTSNFLVDDIAISHLLNYNYAVEDTALLMRKHYSGVMETSSFEYSVKSLKFFHREFNQGTSPLSFRSFITYSTDENFSRESYIDNAFYISHIVVIPKEAKDAKRVGHPEDKFIWASPNAFYILIK